MSKFNQSLFETLPIIGILRNFASKDIQWAAGIYFDAGFNTLEVTMNAANALENIQMLAESYPNRNIGAGSVCNITQLNDAKSMGASFIVSPIINTDLIKTAVAQDLAVFPGAYTPSEIYDAYEAGASAVKIFPVTTVGPSYLKEILAPMPFLKLVPVGGIGVENMQDYLRAGAVGLGMGSGLFPRHLMNEDLTVNLQNHLASIRNSYFETRNQ